MNQKNTWLDITYKALINLNGAGKYKSIYKEVFVIAPDKCNGNPNWKASVRRTIETHSSDSSFFDKKGRYKDLFISLEGIGKGSWGIRNFINEKSYVDVLYMIDEFRSFLDKQWPQTVQKDPLDIFISRKARNNFRNNVIKHRQINKENSYSDLEKINVSNHDLNMNLVFVEAAHIFDVWCIKKIVQNHEKMNSKIVNHLLESLSNPSNALLLPFNYHKVFDMNLIWFDDKTGLMCFNQDFKHDLEKLGIYPTRIKKIIVEQKETMKYLEIRNQYRQSKLNNISSLFQKDIVPLLNIA